MDADGIRKGSITKERTINTAKIIGKNDFAYSTMTGSASLGPLAGAQSHLSNNHITPVIATRVTIKAGKLTLTFLC
jgi:hypothetical protein